MASNLLASDVLDWQERIREQARRLLEGEPVVPRKAPPAISAYDTRMNHEPLVYREPNVINDPNSWLNRGLNNLLETGYTAVFGEGTGNMGADLATGMMGPVSAGATIAAGNRPGVLDFLPGGGALKAGVIAAPKALRVLARTGFRNNAAELATELAQDVVNRLARDGAAVTQQDIYREVGRSVDELGDFAGSATMKSNVADMVQETIDRAQKAQTEGRPFSLTVKPKDKISLRNVDLEETNRPSQTLERLAEYNRDSRARQNEFFKSLPADVQEDIMRRAREEADRQVAEATSNGAVLEKYYGNPNRMRIAVINTERDKQLTKMMKEAETHEHLGTVSSVSGDAAAEDIIRKAGRDAYNAAMAEARANGMSELDVARLAAAASSRAKNQAAREIGGEARNARLAQKNSERQNINTAYSLLSPEVRAEVDEIATQAAEAERAKIIALGESQHTAAARANSVKKDAKFKEVRKRIKAMGFKSVNDPRIGEYETLGRTLEESVRKGGASPVSASQVLAFNPDDMIRSEAAEKALMSGEDPRFIEDIIRGRNAGDTDAIELYNLMFPQ